MKKLIVSIDDSNVIKTNLEIVLEEGGFEMQHAPNGKAAQELVGSLREQGKEFSLVLCDVNMPQMNGMEFLEWFKSQEENKFIPVIMLTTEAEIEMMQKAKQMGATGWVIKPFDQEQLLDVIRKFIR